MKKRFNNIFITLALLLVAAAPILLPGTSFACSSSAAAGSAASNVLNGVGESGTDCNSSGVTSLISTIVSILSLVAGVIAVIMIVVSALRFMTSGGDPQKVAGAKSALVYALIGIAIAALAQALVHFALDTANNVNTTPPAASTPKH
jgi:hypothetical protein